MIAFELNGVHKHYGGPPVVQDVSLKIYQGETVAVIGPNGAGKTTLFGVMAGEHRPTQGTVTLFGQNVTRAGATRMSHLGVVRTFQVARYFIEKSVEQNIFIARDTHERKYRNPFGRRPRTDDIADRALEAIGLASLRGRSSNTLSHGDRKNLEIAMALTQNPRVLLLDEPTAGMGAEDIPRTIELLKSLKRRNPEMTMIITAHDMDVVFALADRIILLANGKIALEGGSEEVRSAPLTQEIYLGNSYGGEE